MSSGQAKISLEAAARHYFACAEPEALDVVVDAAGDLIRYFAGLYGKGCDPEDIFQTGVIGLIKALQNFDPSHGTRFTTYASHCIMGEIRHLVRKNASFYRPGSIVELQFKVDRVVGEYISQHGEVPSYAYIAKRLNVREESVSEVMRAGLVSFDALDAAALRSASYQSFRLPLEDKIILDEAMRTLSETQQKVMDMLFWQDMTQQQVADELGLTQKQVSRLKQSSLRTLQHELKVT